jgi:transposase InsO family protein
VFLKFLKRDIICRYGIPEKIITDNAPNLYSAEIQKLCEHFKIKHHNSAPYRPQMNSAVEAANKNIKKILSKMVVNYKDWHEMLRYALYAYRTNIRSSTGATSYSLVYGMEVVTPI